MDPTLIETGAVRIEARVLKMGFLSSFAHAAGRRAHAENLLVTIDAFGVTGVGEGVPRHHVTGETIDGALHALARVDVGAIEALVAAPSFSEAVHRIEALALGRALAADPVTLAGGAACALELALLDVVARRHAVSLVELPRSLDLLPGQHCETRALTVTIDLDRDAAWLMGFWPAPPHHVKIKLATDFDRDVARVRAVREAVGPEVVLSVDANMAWSFDQAVDMIQRLSQFAIAWYEEPLQKRAYADYARLRQRTGARLMLDESICTLADLAAAIEVGACDLINVKLSKSGGLIPCLRLATSARAAGLELQIGAMVGEMGVLAAARRRLAAMVPAIALDAPALFRHSIVREDRGIDFTTMTCTELPGPGLGVTAHSANIERYTTARRVWSEGSWVTA